MACIDENTALEYVEGLLSEEAAREIEAHAAQCSDCRWLLNTAGNAVLEDSPSEAITHQARPRPPRPAGEEDLAARRIGEVLANTYVIERYIGRGGMGTVYEVSHRRLPRRFAIKFLSESFAGDPVAVARIKREAEITSKLSHPSIVEVVDFDHSEDGTPYMVMTLLEGESLAARLLREGPLADLGEVAEIMRQATSALAAAHRAGVVHRDLKPSNLFLCDRGEHERPLVKVVDFGLSKLARSTRDSTLTLVNAVIGTPAYMSPEQASGHGSTADQRADVFALGATLFKLLTGRAPFSGRNIDEVLAQAASAEIEDESAWRAVPGPLRPVLRRALSREPADRQVTMEALWAELEDAFEASGAWTTARPAAIVPARRSRLPRAAWLVAVGGAGLALGLLWLLVSRAPEPDPPPVGPRAAPPAGPRAAARAALPALPPTPARSALLPDASVPSPRPGTPPRAIRSRAPAGTLVVQSKALHDGTHLWADVFLDGKKIGRTALKVPVPSGVHRVEVRRVGFRRAARTVRVLPGQPARVVFELEPQ